MQRERIGKQRSDIPWQESEFDPEFGEWIVNWYKEKKPILLEQLDKYKKTKDVIVFKTRKEIDEYFKNLNL